MCLYANIHIDYIVHITQAHFSLELLGHLTQVVLVGLCSIGLGALEEQHMLLHLAAENLLRDLRQDHQQVYSSNIHL